MQVVYLSITEHGRSNKIMAVKAIRTDSGWSLKESKELVDRLCGGSVEERFEAKDANALRATGCFNVKMDGVLGSEEVDELFQELIKIFLQEKNGKLLEAMSGVYRMFLEDGGR